MITRRDLASSMLRFFKRASASPPASPSVPLERRAFAFASSDLFARNDLLLAL